MAEKLALEGCSVRLCIEGETLVIVQGHKQNTALEEAIRDLGIETHLIGDCLSPRSAEEAVYEGLIAARKV